MKQGKKSHFLSIYYEITMNQIFNSLASASFRGFSEKNA